MLPVVQWFGKLCVAQLTMICIEHLVSDKVQFNKSTCRLLKVTRLELQKIGRRLAGSRINDSKNRL